MSSLLKDLYTTDFVRQFAIRLSEVVPDANEKEFIKDVFDKDWKNKELKQRMRHLSTVLKKQLSADYKIASKQIVDLIEHLQLKGMREFSLEFMFLPDFIEQFGLHDFHASVKAMQHITVFTSCEFAVRPFLIRYREPMMKQMLVWSKHPHEKVRRLSSEGTRPRLPWAMAVPYLKKDPSPLIPILNNLKSDSSETVRRSVANSINDISKDHPDLALKIVKEWKGISRETDALIKHASRSLLKQGHSEILKFYKLHKSDHFKLTKFQLRQTKIKMGEDLEFTISLENTRPKPSTLRLEYGIYYLLKNGQHSRKVFKISEREIPGYSQIDITRKQKFKPITTKVFYPGKHKISIILNGKEFGERAFRLLGF
ncbi:MAG: DNA alkylation repair protein [Saprospiraceae bacterium]|nr:DNA alkylation repair protein [Saprospiraceae bacterium]